jgi:type II secretory pathway pseudopilin PulG
VYARRHNRAAGFTLLEMMLSTALFLGISSLILGGMISVVRNYRSLEIRNALEQRMRSAFELMAQEIGQAGLQASGLDVSGLVAPLANITQTITSTGSKTVTVDKIGGIFQGASLVVNDGTNQETVVVTAMSTTSPYSITANFALTHTGASTPLYAPGVFPGGILAPDYTASPPRYSSTRSQLMIFGDVNAVGNALVLVRYACPTTFPGAIQRTEWDVATGTWTTPSAGPTPLLDNVTACSFTYPDDPLLAHPIDLTQAPYTASWTDSGGTVRGPFKMVPSVGITITATSQTNDPISNKPFQLTKSFLNIQPRNVLAAIEQVTAGNTSELQPTPTTGIFASLL